MRIPVELVGIIWTAKTRKAPTGGAFEEVLGSGVFRRNLNLVETAGIEPDAAPVFTPTENHNSP
jgi:hypothetical protein